MGGTPVMGDSVDFRGGTPGRNNELLHHALLQNSPNTVLNSENTLFFPTDNIHNRLLPCSETTLCHCCKNIQYVYAQQSREIAELKAEISKLRETATLKSANVPHAPSRSEEPFTDNRILRVKASLFLRGRPLTNNLCRSLVSNLYDNQPAFHFDTDTIKDINQQHGCRDAITLSKWAVLELFSLEELKGRNCLGRVYSVTCEQKEPLDEAKLEQIKTAVFQLYPPQNDRLRREVWNNCIDKINDTLRYLFQSSLKKNKWFQVGI